MHNQCNFALLRDDDQKTFDQKQCRFFNVNKEAQQIKDLSHEAAIEAMGQRLLTQVSEDGGVEWAPP